MSNLKKYNSPQPVQKLGNDSVYGNGYHGNVVISANTTITTDMYYENLTINSDCTLMTNGYRVFVKTNLVLNGYIGLGTVTAGVVGELSSNVATGSISGIETASTSIVYSVGGKGGGGIGTPSATQLPESYRNHIDSLIASAVVTPDGVVVIKGGAKGTTGSQGTTYPALTNADTWPGKAGSVGAAGSGATNGAAGTGAGGSASGTGAGGVGPHISSGTLSQQTHYAGAGTAGHNGTGGSNGTNGAAGTPGTNGVGSTGSPGTATGATPGTGGAGGTAGSGGGLVLIVARNITGSGKVISLGRSGSTGSVGTTGLGGTAGAAGTGATNGAAGTGRVANTAGTPYHHPALTAHHHTPHHEYYYTFHSHTAGESNGPSTYHAGHGDYYGHNHHHFTNGSYHGHLAGMNPSAHTTHGNLAHNNFKLYDGNVHGHGQYRKYQPQSYLGHNANPHSPHVAAQTSPGGVAHSPAGHDSHGGAAGHPGTNGAAGHPGTNGAGGLAAPSSGTGGTGKRGGAGGGGGIIIITETTPPSITYDTRAGLTADIDTHAADSGYSYVILNQ